MDTVGRTSTTAWRRQRLLNIGANPSNTSATEPEDHTEQTHLTDSVSRARSYGTVPSPRAFRSSHRARNGISLPDINTSSLPQSVPQTPLRTPREFSSGIRFRRTKTISTYDPPLSTLYHADGFREIPNTKWNGIRVWYSSFSSVDWLHDAIKESSRLWQLRSRKSLRGRLLSALDRSVDWFTVTVVGILIASVAFFVIRGEQYFFDLKEGRCLDTWWHAKRFCNNWQSWAEMFGESGGNGDGLLLGYWWWIVEYAVYATVAVSSPKC